MGFPPITVVTPRRCLAVLASLIGAVVVCLLGVVPMASAATPLNVTGTYTSVYHCQTGWCAGEEFPSTTTLRQASGSNTVYDGANAGTLNGNVLTIHEVSGSYSWTSVLTFSGGAQSFSGSLKDSNNTTGVDEGTLEVSTAAATSLDGTWQCCGDGGASPQVFVINGTSGTAEQQNGSPFATITATLVGNQATIVTTYTASTYVATFTGTLTGSDINGSWTSNYGQSGTFTATLTGAVGGAPTSARTDLAPITSTISTPGQIFHSMKHNLVNAAITVGAIIFITFPANIFNRTFQANYDEIMLILAKWRRRLRHPFKRAPATEELSPHAAVDPATDETPGKVNVVLFALVLLLGAIFGGLLNPHFGLNTTSLEGVVATLISFAIGAVLSWSVARLFRRHHDYATSTYLQALPLGLVIAAICVLVSRLSSFEPGYLYGVVVGISFAGSLKERHSAHLTAISVGSTLLVALLAWFVWLPVNSLAHSHGTNALIVVADDVLGSIFVGGLVGSVISLIPIDFLPGKVIAKWHRGVWALIFFVATFLLIEVELRPASGSTHPGHASLETVIALFVLFGGATFLMRWFFERRDKTVVAPATLEVPAEE